MERQPIDSIISEVRAERDAHAARFDYDVAAIFRDIRAMQEESGREYVNASRRPVAARRCWRRQGRDRGHCPTRSECPPMRPAVPMIAAVRAGMLSVPSGALLPWPPQRTWRRNTGRVPLARGSGVTRVRSGTATPSRGGACGTRSSVDKVLSRPRKDGTSLGPRVARRLVIYWTDG